MFIFFTVNQLTTQNEFWVGRLKWLNFGLIFFQPGLKENEHFWTLQKEQRKKKEGVFSRLFVTWHLQI